MGFDDPCCEEDPLSGADQATPARLATIESQMQHIEALLNGVSQFNNRLDQIHATLDLAIGILTPGQHTTDPTSEPSPSEDTDDTQTGFRIIAHLSRDGHSARLVSDLSWTDMWSVRLYITALLRNLARSSLASHDCPCRCEVWKPDETGQLVDSARQNPDTGVIEWESDLHDGDDQL